MPALFSTTKLQSLSDWFVSHLLTDTPTEKDISDETTGAVMKFVLFARNTDVHTPDQLVINSVKYRVFDVEDPGTYEVLRRARAVRFPQRGAVS